MKDGFPNEECIKGENHSWGNSAHTPNYGKIGSGISISSGIILVITSFISIKLCQGLGESN